MSIKIEVLKENFTQEKFEEQLKDWDITPYLTLAQKYYIINGADGDNGLVDNILKKDENGLFYIDRFAYEVNLAHILLEWYANIEFVEFDDTDYDFVTEKGIIDTIMYKVEDDWFRFTGILDNVLKDELEKRNSLSSVISQLGNQLIDKINQISDPKNLNKLIKAVNKIENPAILDIIKENMGQLNLNSVVGNVDKGSSKGKKKV